MPGSYHVSLKGLLLNEAVENQFWFLSDETDNTLAGADALALNFDTVMLPLYLDCLPAEYLYQSVTVRGAIATSGGLTPTPPIIYTEGSPPGTRAGSVLSNQNGPIVVFYPAAAPGERQRLCKTFLPGIVEADAGGNIITAAALSAAIIAFFTAMDTTLTIGATHYDWVAAINPPPGFPVPEIREIQGWFLRDGIASQRNRRPRT